MSSPFSSHPSPSSFILTLHWHFIEKGPQTKELSHNPPRAWPPACQHLQTHAQPSFLFLVMDLEKHRNLNTIPAVFQNHLSTSPKGTAPDTLFSLPHYSLSLLTRIFSSPFCDLTQRLKHSEPILFFPPWLAKILPLVASSREAQINHTSQVLTYSPGSVAFIFAWHLGGVWNDFLVCHRGCSSLFWLEDN